jgi:hypothetical protein
VCADYLRNRFEKPRNGLETTEELSSQYGKIAKLLDEARSKELADDAKIEVLREALRTEESCIRRIRNFLA